MPQATRDQKSLFAYDRVRDSLPELQWDFGNVETLLSFRVGAEDTAILTEEYAPVFSPKDILNLGVRDFYCKMPIRGEITQAFSGRTLEIQFPSENKSGQCIAFSCSKYCLPVQEV